MSEREDLPDFVTDESHSRQAAIPNKVGRFLWVTITARHSDKTEDEKATLWNVLPQREREKWVAWAETLIDAVDTIRRAQAPPDPLELVTQARGAMEKTLRLHERDLYATGSGEDVEKRKERGKTAMPKYVQGLKDLVKMEAEMKANHQKDWASLSKEDQAESFLASMESWPTVAREYMAGRFKELFPKAFHKAAADLKVVG